jgi:hypothetical protein
MTVNLTGVWASDDDGRYYVRQYGSDVWFSGEDKNGRWTRVFAGTLISPNVGPDILSGVGQKVSPTIVRGDWASVPRAREKRDGTLTLNVKADNVMLMQEQTGGFSGKRLTKVAQWGDGSPFTFKDAAYTDENDRLTGAWRDNKGFFYYFRQIKDKVWWLAGHPSGAWGNVFHGTQRGRVTKGRWIDVPAGTGTNPVSASGSHSGVPAYKLEQRPEKEYAETEEKQTVLTAGDIELQLKAVEDNWPQALSQITQPASYKGTSWTRLDEHGVWRISFESVTCVKPNEMNDLAGSTKGDEPYALIAVSDLSPLGRGRVTRMNPPIASLNMYHTKVFQNVMESKTAAQSLPVWGMAQADSVAQPAPITSPEDLLLLVAAMESDYTSVDNLTVDVQATLIGLLTDYLLNNFDTPSIATSLRTGMDAAIKDFALADAAAVTPGPPDPDDLVGGTQRLKLTAQDLVNARASGRLVKTLEFNNKEGDYKIEINVVPGVG